jgi:hypothetical protein
MFDVSLAGFGEHQEPIAVGADPRTVCLLDVNERGAGRLSEGR